MDEIPYTESGRLWISDIQTVAESSTDYLDVVVSTCQDTCRENVGCTYEHFDLADGEQSNEQWGGAYDYESFADAMDYVTIKLEFDRNVCVHCHRGRSRSVSVSMGALGRMLDLRPHEAFGLIKEHRTQASPDELLYNHASRYIENR
jgi:predicted protein tyrosine phosphatase